MLLEAQMKKKTYYRENSVILSRDIYGNVLDPKGNPWSTSFDPYSHLRPNPPETTVCLDYANNRSPENSLLRSNNPETNIFIDIPDIADPRHCPPKNSLLRPTHPSVNPCSLDPDPSLVTPGLPYENNASGEGILSVAPLGDYLK